MVSKCAHSRRVHLHGFIFYDSLTISIINPLGLVKTSYILQINHFKENLPSKIVLASCNSTFFTCLLLCIVKVSPEVSLQI